MIELLILHFKVSIILFFLSFGIITVFKNRLERNGWLYEFEDVKYLYLSIVYFIASLIPIVRFFVLFMHILSLFVEYDLSIDYLRKQNYGLKISFIKYKNGTTPCIGDKVRMSYTNDNKPPVVGWLFMVNDKLSIVYITYGKKSKRKFRFTRAMMYNNFEKLEDYSFTKHTLMNNKNEGES